MEITLTRDECYKQYHERLRVHTRLLDAAKNDIAALLESAKLKTNSLTGRVKDFESLYQKISKEGSKSIQTISDIKDIVGIRVVLIFVDDLDRVQDILSPTFDILEVDRKGLTRSEDHFGYESDHYLLRYNKVKGPAYEGLNEVVFELQVRTILMDAWDSLSHVLDYKTGEAIPTHLRKIFFGLSDMFVVADRTFQDLRKAATQSKATLKRERKTLASVLPQEINLDTLKLYLKYKFPERYAQSSNREDSDEMYSEFIQEIKNLGGYKIIKDIDDAVDAAWEAEQQAEYDTFKGNGQRHLVGNLRGILDLYDDRYYKSRFRPEDPHVFVEEKVRKEKFRHLVKSKK